MNSNKNHTELIDDDSGFYGTRSATSSFNDIDVVPEDHSNQSEEDTHIDKTLERSKKVNEKSNIEMYIDSRTTLFSNNSNNRNSIYYDADVEDFNNNDEKDKYYDNSTDELLFRFCQDTQGTIYTLQRAISIIEKKPKLSHKAFEVDPLTDSDHESEYEIIESADSFSSQTSCGKHCSKLIIPNISICTHNISDDNEIEVISFHYADKTKVGKVKSLPNLRFPLRKSKNTRTYRPIRSIKFEADSSLDLEDKCKNENCCKLCYKSCIQNQVLQNEETNIKENHGRFRIFTVSQDDLVFYDHSIEKQDDDNTSSNSSDSTNRSI